MLYNWPPWVYPVTLKEPWVNLYIHAYYALFPSVVYVNWTISEAVKVTEGDGVEVHLSGEAFGIYANPITIGVVCSATVANAATDLDPGMDTILSNDNSMLLL